MTAVRRHRAPAAALLALLTIAVIAFAQPAAAASLEVTTTAEQGPGSLGETILEAGPGDTIEIPPGEYLLVNGDTLVEQQNILHGAGAERTTVIPSGGGTALTAISYSDLTVAPARQAEGAGETDSKIDTKAQVIALIATIAIFLLILDLVRRRRLAERYALLWLSAAVALLVLAIWTDGLDVIADLIGISEPANAIFILAFGVAFLLLLNFSVATSRLSEETKILAQEAARLDQELREARGEPSGERDRSAATGAEQSEHEPPVGPQDQP
jgi:hypothetical protein